MTTIPRVEFASGVLDVDLSNQTQSMNAIRQEVIPQLLNRDDWLSSSSLRFRKITKNDNIKETVAKLEQNDKAGIECVYSYGPHLQKMLSIVEIYKKAMERKSIKVVQYNKISSFTSITEGRNLLLEKRTRVPILVIFIADEQNSSLPRDLLLQRGFTRQS